MQREGHYNVPPQAGPILGVEFAGHIEQLGEGATGGFKVGDEVFGLAYGGVPLPVLSFPVMLLMIIYLRSI